MGLRDWERPGGDTIGALLRLRRWSRRPRATNRKCGATCTNQLPDRTGTREWHRFAFGRSDRSRASAPLVRVRSIFRKGRATVEAERSPGSLELHSREDQSGDRFDHWEILS